PRQHGTGGPGRRRSRGQPRWRDSPEARARAVARQTRPRGRDAQVRGPWLRRDRCATRMLSRKRSRQRLPGAEKNPRRGVMIMIQKRKATHPTVHDNAAIDAMIATAKQRAAKAYRTIRRPEARVSMIASPIGDLLVAESERGLLGLHFMWISSADRMLE